MKRGIPVVVALLAGAFAAPTYAAPSPTVVYEVVRGPGARTGVEVTISVVGSGPTLFATATLVPDSAGYQAQYASVHRAYEGGAQSKGSLLLRGGERFLVGAERGRVRVTVDAKGWSVRVLGDGFRFVNADAPPLVAGVESFGHASAPAGPYGSLAFAMVPCDPGVGSWTLAAENEPGRTYTCPTDGTFGALPTRRARRWDLDAEVYGVRADDARLVVLDFPKRPR